MPKLSTTNKKQLRLEIAVDILDCAHTDPNFLNTIIVGDGSWVFGYDLNIKIQS